MFSFGVSILLLFVSLICLFNLNKFCWKLFLILLCFLVTLFLLVSVTNDPNLLFRCCDNLRTLQPEVSNMIKNFPPCGYVPAKVFLLLCNTSVNERPPPQHLKTIPPVHTEGQDSPLILLSLDLRSLDFADHLYHMYKFA